MDKQLFGIIPPITTPFRPDGTIDEECLRAEVRYLVEVAGVHGVAVGGSTGEGHTLSTEEIRLLTGVVTEEVAGRVPVIMGIIVNSTRAAIERGRAVRDLGIAALQVTPVHYLFRPDDDSTQPVRDLLQRRPAAHDPTRGPPLPRVCGRQRRDFRTVVAPDHAGGAVCLFRGDAPQRARHTL
jgi:dihydrodipicolinate synthase/N-acetylneuraminate lyase